MEFIKEVVRRRLALASKWQPLCAAKGAANSLPRYFVPLSSLDAPSDCTLDLTEVFRPQVLLNALRQETSCIGALPSTMVDVS